MSNINSNSDACTLSKTIRDIDNGSTALIIPNDLAKELDIEDSKVSMTIILGLFDKKHLVVSKYYKEIKIE